MITTALSAVVGAPRERVWRAISDPEEVVRWDESTLALLDPRDGYPEVGQLVRWRYRQGSVAVLLRDRPLEVVCGERLRSDVALGLFRFDQTWSLADDEGDTARTRLGLRLAAANSIPVWGESVDRFDVRRLSAEYVDTRLRAVQKWCEGSDA